MLYEQTCSEQPDVPWEVIPVNILLPTTRGLGPGAVGWGERWDSFQRFASANTQLLHLGLHYYAASTVQGVSSLPFTQEGLEGWENAHKTSPTSNKAGLKR